MKSGLLGLACLAVLCITLSLGLWPFHSPANQVAWLNKTDGVSFGNNGTILGSGSLKADGLQDCACRSLEIWAQPEYSNASATLLAIYTPSNPRLFALRQSLADLELRTSIQTSNGRLKESRFYVDYAFHDSLEQRKALFITVTSGFPGTTVYIDGALARTAPHFSIPADAFTGNLVVGDSPRQPDSYTGQIRGIALYGATLTAAQVRRHYDTWTTSGRPAITPGERTLALYLFDEHAGSVIHNRANAGADLCIPRRYVVVNKLFMEPFWTEFSLSRSYWKGVLKNIVGFIPLGICFYAYGSVILQLKRPTATVIALGALVSLTIEVLQVFLPTRDSGTTDIVTNTLGTWLGILSYRALGRFAVTERTSEWSWKRPTRCSS